MQALRIRNGGYALSLVLLLVFELGCAGAQRFDVTVNSLAEAREIEGQRYVLLPGDALLGEDDPQFRDFARIVELGLADRGLVRVSQIENADFSVLLEWSVGDPETKTVIFREAALAGANFYSSPRYDREWGHRGGREYGAYYAPTYSAPLSVRFTTVNRLLSLEARALEAGTPARQGRTLWSTTVESRGSSENLRRVIPVLVGAATSYVGMGTVQSIEMTIASDDERVQRLESALAESGALPILEDSSAR